MFSPCPILRCWCAGMAGLSLLRCARRFGGGFVEESILEAVAPLASGDQAGNFLPSEG